MKYPLTLKLGTSNSNTTSIFARVCNPLLARHQTIKRSRSAAPHRPFQRLTRCMLFDPSRQSYQRLGPTQRAKAYRRLAPAQSNSKSSRDCCTAGNPFRAPLRARVLDRAHPQPSAQPTRPRPPHLRRRNVDQTCRTHRPLVRQNQRRVRRTNTPATDHRATQLNGIAAHQPSTTSSRLRSIIEIPAVDAEISMIT